MKYILMLCIKVYQILFSFDHGIPHKLFPGYRICIYHPSCSEYGYLSIKKYGTFLGSYLTLIRILKCGPWSDGGNDSVKEIKLPRWLKWIQKI